MTNTFTQYGARLGVTLNKINGNIAFEVGDTFSNGRNGYIVSKVLPKVDNLIYIDVIAGPMDDLSSCEEYHFDHLFLKEEVYVDGYFLFPWIGTYPGKVNEFNLHKNQSTL